MEDSKKVKVNITLVSGQTNTILMKLTSSGELIGLLVGDDGGGGEVFKKIGFGLRMSEVAMIEVLD